MPCGIPQGARCVQRFDDSLKSAIHITYRISLRSSSMREPRDPLLKVVLKFWEGSKKSQTRKSILGFIFVVCRKDMNHWTRRKSKAKRVLGASLKTECYFEKVLSTNPTIHKRCTGGKRMKSLDLPACTCPRRGPATTRKSLLFDNDPSAGSPTETLLRLLLPLNDTVWASLE